MVAKTDVKAMNRKLLITAVAVAAVAALLAGVLLGRNIISSDAPPDVVRFRDTPSKTSISYPAAWKRSPEQKGEPDVALRVATKDGSASLQIRSTPVDFGSTVTRAGLAVVRKFTDPLIAATRVKSLEAPQPVEVGGLAGWRYRYTYGSGKDAGAHDHYFLFKRRLMIQLVFQAVPKKSFSKLDPVFEQIAATFRGNGA